MKRKSVAILSLLATLTLTGCSFREWIDNFVESITNNGDKGNTGNSGNSDSRTGSSTLKIISVNDFHGIVESSSSYPGMSAMGAKIKELYNADVNNTIILSAGDMFQGSGVSSVSKGKVVVDAMNDLKFDCMTIGNHEFDWGLDTLRMAHDGVERDFDNSTNTQANPEANFPYLACNIYYNNGTSSTSDDTYASDICKPYTIIEKANMKIGVIGYIGTDQYSSICATISAPLKFHDPLDIIKQQAEKLRTEEGCDFIVANGHNADSSLNQSLYNLTGNQRIDYILNGHSHSTYITGFSTNQYAIQSGAYGQKIGYAQFVYSFNSKAVTDSSVVNINMSEYASMSDPTLTTLVNKHVNAASLVLNKVIGKNGTSRVTSSNKNQICHWISDCVREQVGADFGITNYGGVRTGVFPIEANANLTINTMIGIMPFDNTIVVTKMTGKKLKSLMTNNGSYYGTSFNYDADIIDDTTVYNVAFDEYSFGKVSSYYSSYQFSEYLVRDAMVHELEFNTENNETWDLTRIAAFNS